MANHDADKHRTGNPLILFSLRCAKDHRFDSWFRSGDDFDRLAASGTLACPECDDTVITKAPMAPPVRTSDTGPAPVAVPSRPLSGPPNHPSHAAIAELRRQIEANSDDVGTGFVAEARAIHLGDRPARAIRGQARPDQARALIEDGIPIVPLPFFPTRKSN